MSKPNSSSATAFSEVNLKLFLKKVYQRKWLFATSLALFLGLGYVFIKVAAPIYQVQSSLLIDTNDITRMQENSKFVDGGIGLAKAEKNIFNEIGILKSYQLIEQTLQELDVDVSYYAGNWPIIREVSGQLPFKVVLTPGANQLPNEAFRLELLEDDQFRLSIKVKKPEIALADQPTTVKAEASLEFSGVYRFGQVVSHEYFHFSIYGMPEHVAKFEGQELYFKTHRLRDLAEAYQEKIDVAREDIKSSIILIQSQGPVLENEIRFLNRLADNYIISKARQRDEQVNGKEEFIKNQLETISENLAEAEKSLESFKKGANAIDLRKTASISLEKLQRLESEKGQIELNNDYYFSLLKYLGEGDRYEKIMAPSIVGINDPVLNDNLIELKRLNAERSRMKYYKGKDSYDLEILDRQIRTTAIALQENLKNLMSSSRMALKNIDRQIAELEQTIDQLPGNEQKLLSYERKSGLYENLYNYLNQELAKTEIASAKQISDTRILDEARMTGDGPVFPQPALILAIASILGLLFPMAWIVLADSFNEEVYDQASLEANTRIPVIASIPHLPKRSLVFGQQAKWTVEESFRNLAAQLSFLIPNPKKNVIGITSFNTGEGKSFCSINLSLNLATAGKKVLLIDTDFRKPSLLGGAAKVPGGGLSHFLKGEVGNMEDIIKVHPDIPRLHYIPTERELGNPQQFLNDRRMEQLIKTSSFEYDYVIIDSPAVGLVSDYLILAKWVDINLFILRRNRSKTTFVEELEKLQTNGDMKNAFIVFNGVRRNYRKYGYGYGYSKEDAKDVQPVVIRNLSDK